LKIHETLFPAILLDESAGGFSVLICNPPDLNAEEVILLQADMAWYKVRVVHVAAADPPEDGEDNPCENEELAPQVSWRRLGLLRLGEVGAPEPPPVSWFSRSLLGKYLPSLEGAGVKFQGKLALGGKGRRWAMGRQSAFLGVVLAVLIVFTPILFFGSVKGYGIAGRWDSVEIPQWKNYASGLKTPYHPKRNPAPPSSSHADSSHPGFSQPPPQGDSQVRNDVSATIRRLHSPTVLTVPEVVNYLQLSDAQQEQIRRIIQAASEKMRALDASSRNLPRSELKQLRKQMIDDAMREALELLDENQRAEWEKIAANQWPKPDAITPPKEPAVP